MDLATFGAGCFWNVELEFRKLNGVIDTSVGFMGGFKPFPSYAEVCEGSTGHTEVVQVLYDPSIISYDDLLEAFWSMHDPTIKQANEGKNGRQYKSVIYYHSATQHRIAQRSRDRIEFMRIWNDEINTLIELATEFFRAEEYHQQYLMKRGIRKASF